MGPATAKQRAGGREALLDAAVSVIAEHGSGALTFRAVAERARVSPGTASYHFASTDELLIAAVEHGAGRTARMLEQLALDLQATDWSIDAWMEAFAAALAGDAEHQRENHLACMELQLLAARHEELVPAATRIQLAYARVARMALQPLGVEGAELDQLAVNLTAMMTGLILREIVNPQPGAAERLVAALHAARPDISH